MPWWLWVFVWVAIAVAVAVTLGAVIHLRERRRHLEHPSEVRDREPPAAAVL